MDLDKFVANQLESATIEQLRDIATNGIELNPLDHGDMVEALERVFVEQAKDKLSAMNTIERHIESLPIKWRSDDGLLTISRANTEKKSFWVQSGRLCVWTDTLEIQAEDDNDPVANELVIDCATRLQISFFEANSIKKFIDSESEK